MTILVDKNTRVLVQGATGREGSSHTLAMLKYGTKILAGVTPGKAGTDVGGVPIYNTVKQAIDAHPEINASIIFVPAAFNADAVYEALDSDLKLIVDITEHVPIHDSLEFVNYARDRGVTIIGPNCPGVISPVDCKLRYHAWPDFLKGQCRDRFEKRHFDLRDRLGALESWFRAIHRCGSGRRSDHREGHRRSH